MQPYLDALGGSKLFWGIATIVASIGSRFVVGELTPLQSSFLRHPAFKRAALFCIIFMPTRDILVSASLTVVASVILECILNEGSKFCLLPECLKLRKASLPLQPALFGVQTARLAIVGDHHRRPPDESTDEIIDNIFLS